MAVGRLVGVAASLTLILVGCGHRTPGECTVACAADGQCPEDSTCGNDGYCHASDDRAVCLPGQDLPDAAPPADAEPADAASCDGVPDEIAESDARDVSIPDDDAVGIDRTIAFDTGCVTVQSVEVRVEIVHEYRGDIEIRLTSPAGETALLLDSSDDATPDVFETFVVDLAAGESAEGDWMLNVRDVFMTDVGTLQFWSIGVNMAAP